MVSRDFDHGVRLQQFSSGLPILAIEFDIPPVETVFATESDDRTVDEPVFGNARETVAYSSTVDTDNDVGYSYLHNPDSTCFSPFCEPGHENQRQSRPLTQGNTMFPEETSSPGDTSPDEQSATTFSDTKDWTWVLERPCPECGFDAASVSLADLPDALRDNALAWTKILEGSSELLRTRPRPDVWSPLEYAFHVRDVFELYDYRLGLMLDEDGPSYPNWDQDETAIEKDYRNASPATVSLELVDWAEKLASRFEGVSGAAWNRTGFRSDGAEFTVDGFARYLLHDPVHHLWDVRH